MAGHAQIGIVVATVDRHSAGERDLGHIVPRIGQEVGMTVGASEPVLDMGCRGILAFF